MPERLQHPHNVDLDFLWSLLDEPRKLGLAAPVGFPQEAEFDDSNTFRNSRVQRGGGKDVDILHLRFRDLMFQVLR